MMILGGKEMLKVPETKLLFRFWAKEKDCRAVITDPTPETIANIIKHDLEIFSECLEDLSFYIYYGTNSYIGEPFADMSDGYESTHLCVTDVNIVGDASPLETLWFVFEREEWKWLEEQTGIDFERLLNKNWHHWVSDFEGNKHESWVTNHFFDRTDIVVSAKIEVKLN